MTATILAGDVGGTKIHLGLYRAEGGTLTPLRDHQYATAACDSLEAPLMMFRDPGEKITAACFGVPGPVIDGAARPVNIPWGMDEHALMQILDGAPVRLLNDLETTAWGTLHLREADLVTLQAGAARSTPANRVVIAAGTGLGEAGLVFTESEWHVVACEGGHADFAPRGAEQIALLEFLAREFDHVSFERVLSGPGLHNIYRFLRSRQTGPEPAWLIEQMRGHDPAAVIGEAGIAGRDPQCARAVELFSAIYGAEAANLALKYLALGGVYLCGGIAPKLIPALRAGGLVRSFLDKGRLRATLERVSVHVSLNENTGLIGAAHVAAAIV